MASKLQKFATQASPHVLADVRAIAEAEGRLFQAVVEEALADWVERKRSERPRLDVVAHLGALEAAVHRPVSGYYDDPISQTAALGESILMNRPFVDGNKRVALVAMDVHLRLQGLTIEVSADAGERFIVGSLEEHSLNSTTLAEWLGACVRPLPEV